MRKTEIKFCDFTDNNMVDGNAKITIDDDLGVIKIKVCCWYFTNGCGEVIIKKDKVIVKTDTGKQYTEPTPWS